MSRPTAYFCQASELFKVTNTLTRRDQLKRCVYEVRTGQCGAVEMVRRVAIWLFWRIRRRLLGEYPHGRHTSTPTGSLDLKPGEWVEVQPMKSICETLSPKGLNRGLSFSPDMRLACGRCYRVNDRVDRIIEDGTGKMRHLQNTVSLEGSLCSCPHILHGGPDMAPIPPAFSAPRRSRGAPLSYMGAPTWPPFPRAFGTPRRSRGAPLDCPESR